MQESGKILVTMSSAHQVDVPLNAATFLAQAGAKAGDRKHTHLIGDALVLGEQIAEAALTLDDAVAGVRRAFTNGQEKTLFEKKTLAPRTQQQVKLYGAMGRTMGLPVQVASSVAFVRDNNLRSDVVNFLATLYSQGASRQFDVRDFYDLLQLDHTDDVATHSTFSKIACATIPKRFRNLPPDEQLKKSFYAAMEGAIAAALIDGGAQYLSYQGADVVNEKPRMTSIDMMRFMTIVAVKLAMSNPELCDKIKSKNGFVVDPELNGLGFGVSDKGKLVYESVNDPHTMQRGEPPASHTGVNATTEHVITTKLPLILMVDGQYVPVTADEFDRVAADETGGIFGSHWLKNFPAMDAFFKADPERITDVENRIRRQSPSFRSGDVGVWLDSVRGAKPDSRGIPAKVDVVVPGRIAPAAGVMVNMLAEHVVDSM